MKSLKQMETFGYLFLALGALVTIIGGYLLSKNTDKVNSARIEDLKVEIVRKEKELSLKTQELSEKTEFIKEINKRIETNVSDIGGIVSEISGLTKEIEFSSSYLRNEVEQKKIELNLAEYSAQFEGDYSVYLGDDKDEVVKRFNITKNISFRISFWQIDKEGLKTSNEAVITGKWVHDELDEIERPLAPNFFMVKIWEEKFIINQATMVFDAQKGTSFKKDRRLYFQIYTIEAPFFRLQPKFGIYSKDRSQIIWAIIPKNSNLGYTGYFEKLY